MAATVSHSESRMAFSKRYLKMRLAYLLLVLAWVLTISWLDTPAAWAETTKKVTSPSDLRPHSILNDFDIVAPKYLRDELTSRKMSFFTFDVANVEYLILSEKDTCDPLGCLHVFFEIDQKTLMNPVAIFSNEPVWVDEINFDLSTKKLCASRRIMFVCQGG